MKFPGWLVRDKCRRFQARLEERRSKPSPKWFSWGDSCHRARLSMELISSRIGTTQNSGDSSLRKAWRTAQKATNLKLEQIETHRKNAWRDRIYKISVSLGLRLKPGRTSDLFEMRVFAETLKLNRRTGTERIRHPDTWVQSYHRSYLTFRYVKSETPPLRIWKLCHSLIMQRAVSYHDEWAGCAVRNVRRLGDQ